MATATRKLEEAALPALVKLKAAVQKEFPAIYSLHYSLGEDFFGNPAIKILAVLEDSFLTEARKLGKTRVDLSDFVRLTLLREFYETDVDLYPYLSLISKEDFLSPNVESNLHWKPIPDAD